MSNSAFNPLYLTLFLLVACFAITLFISMRLRREVEEDSTPTTPKEVYGPLEQAYYAGLMHEEEYLRIREQMARAAAGTAVADQPATAGKKKPHPPVDEWASWDAPGA
ncbi:hypothetical protein TA3x_003544 [Tundrisphaera sp. TA3]|uniref:hypothetical protein n=1 Tax=Tundrisphaera sp. TA3 TaxID=3435775 RepID=UPI003EBAB66D